MQKEVPGMDVPDEIMHAAQGCSQRERVPTKASRSPVSRLQNSRRCKGVAGVHLMAIEWEHKVPEIAERAGLLPAR